METSSNYPKFFASMLRPQTGTKLLFQLPEIEGGYGFCPKNGGSLKANDIILTEFNAMFIPLMYFEARNAECEQDMFDLLKLEKV